MEKQAVTADIMAEIDERAQDEYGVSQELLMEHAGRSVAETLLSDSSDIKNENILIFCGKGNNGGDGFVLARHLAEAGNNNIMIYVIDIENIKNGAACDNFLKIKEMGLDIRSLHDFEVMSKEVLKVTIVVDSIFGTGFKGELPDEITLIWEYFNAIDIKRYAVDVPSGLNASTGEASKSCFRANRTISFGLPKKGFYLNDGPKVCGEVVVVDIGLPKELLAQYR